MYSNPINLLYTIPCNKQKLKLPQGRHKCNWSPKDIRVHVHEHSKFMDIKWDLDRITQPLNKSDMHLNTWNEIITISCFLITVFEWAGN